AAEQQPSKDLAATQAGIDQQAGTGAGDKRAIASAPTCQDRYRYSHKSEHKWKVETGGSD
ncbi:MAG: hypothetical protein WCC25_18015, partial [Candidatus Korobacteraceae bacterium]